MKTMSEIKHVDYIDEAAAEWRSEKPNLDTAGLEIGARIAVLQRHLERRADRHLAEYGLQTWGFDVLASLLRSGPPYTQTPTRLMRNCFLSSGAVTNRLNRLEAKGLVSRAQDLKDRRSFTVTLTESGVELASRAIESRVDYLRPVFEALDKDEKRSLVPLLRKLLLEIERLEGWV